MFDIDIPLFFSAMFLTLVAIISFFPLYLSRKPPDFLVFLWVISTPLCIIFFIAGGLNYSGYCWEKKRWLRDEEFLPRICNKNNTLKIDAAYPYEAISKFEEDNREHCILQKDYVVFFNKILGSSYMYLEIQYKEDQNSAYAINNNKEEYYKSYVWLDACAKAVEHYGENIYLNKEE